MKNGNVWYPPSSKEAEELLQQLSVDGEETYVGRASRLFGMGNGKGRKRVMQILNGNAKMNKLEYDQIKTIIEEGK